MPEKTDNSVNQGVFSEEDKQNLRRQHEIDQLEGLYNSSPSDSPKGKLQLRGKLKRWGIAGLITLVIGGGAYGVFDVLSGPLEIMHFGELLKQFHLLDEEKFGDGRLGQLYRWARTYNSPEKRNLSFWGNKVADHLDKKLQAIGVKQGYEFGRIRYLEIDTTKQGGKDAVEQLREQGISADNLRPDANGKVKVDIDTRRPGSARFRRQTISGLVGMLGMNDISTAVGSRILKIRAGVDFHPLKNVARAADESLKLYYKNWKDSRNQRIRNGVDTSQHVSATSQQNTNSNDPHAASQNAAANSTTDQTNNIISQASDPSVSVEARSAKLRAALTAGVGPIAAISAICGLRAIGNAAADLQYTNLVLPMMRIGMGAVSMASQIQNGTDVNMDEMGAVHNQLNDVTNKLSWSDAKSIQAELHQKQTGPDLPEAAKPGKSIPPFFTTLNNAINKIGAGSFCNAVSSTAGAIVISGINIAADATGVFTAILAAGGEFVQYQLMGEIIPNVVRWLAGDQVDPNGAGALLGNYANYGARLAGNDIALSQGGQELSPQEEAQVSFERDATLQEADQQKSFFARYLDLREPRSLMAKLAFETPFIKRPNMAVTAVLSSPTKLFSNLSMPIFNLTTKNAQAIAINYTYPFPKFGHSVDQINKEDELNPYEQADKIVEPNLDRLDKEYGDCFNRTVDPNTFTLMSSQAKRYDQIDSKCNDKNNNELTQYSFYIANMSAIKSAACYLGEDDACAEVGFGTPQTTQPAGPTDNSALFQDSTGVACAPGTIDAGIQDGYHDGQLVKIRVCAVPSISCNGQECQSLGHGFAVVNSRISAAFNSLGEDAKKAGVPMTANSSFRTMAHQQSLCPCDGKTVAKPGYSNHQMGLAIDFNIRAGDKWYQWLKLAAGNYGIKNYPLEAWHWSATGN